MKGRGLMFPTGSIDSGVGGIDLILILGGILILWFLTPLVIQHIWCWDASGDLKAMLSMRSGAPLIKFEGCEEIQGVRPFPERLDYGAGEGHGRGSLAITCILQVMRGGEVCW